MKSETRFPPPWCPPASPMQKENRMEQNLFSLYVMVSIPEAKIENIFAPPIILGVFDSKESAKNAWKQRSKEFRDIRAKTVHTYYETFATNRTELPSDLYLWALYHVYKLIGREVPEFVFHPYGNGYFETYDECLSRIEEVKQLNPRSWKDIRDSCGFTFYASNEWIVEKIELNRLVRIPVQITEKTDAIKIN